jgi:TatD-related deoxyribonuclease
MHILDDHLHLDPHGRHVDSLREFEKAGGTHVILCHMPYKGTQIKIGQDFRKQYQITLDLAERCRRETSVKVHTMLGPYPGHVPWLWDKLGPDATVQAMREGMEIAAGLVRAGDALGIGEIGRPHFPVSEEIWAASNDLMRYGMELAREAGCAVQLHTESAGPEVWRELASMADDVGLARDRVVKHYSGPAILETENFGLFPSVLSSKDNIKAAAEKGSRFMMETDFLDDTRRPGAVFAPATVPRRTKAMLESGIFSDDTVAKVHGEWPRKIYGMDI